ncbi:hypothetical protein GBA52_022426 [Prunus armeniaca]|nr:hypothetical protein GBA52_022426 [Prunus armeniaca]
MTSTAGAFRFPTLAFLLVTLLFLLFFFLSFSPFSGNQLNIPLISSFTAFFNLKESNYTAPPHVSVDGLLTKSMYRRRSGHKFNSSNFLVLCDQNKTSLERIEEDLAQARAAIREAIQSRNYKSERTETFIPRGSIYKNPYAFHQLSIAN